MRKLSQTKYNIQQRNRYASRTPQQIEKRKLYLQDIRLAKALKTKVTEGSS